MKSRSKNCRPTLEALEDRLVPYALSGYQWANTNVSASFMPDGTISDGGVPSNLFATLNAVAPTETWQREFARALQTWADVTPLNFHFVSDSGAESGTNGLSQGDSRFGDTRFGGYAATNFVGIGYFPSGDTRSGDASLNTAVAWHIGTDTDLYSVLLHETGHTIGLDHSQVAAVMYPTIWSVFSGLYADDIAGAQAIYGSRQPDAYDAAAKNDGIPSASVLTVDGSGALSISADLSSLADIDFYRVTAPAGSNGNLTVSVDARNLSLLDPKVSVYGSTGNLLGTVSATTYGSVATMNLSGLAGGQTYYLVADGATSDVFGMGAYNLKTQFSGFSTLSPPMPTLAINGVSLAEGNTGTKLARFMVTLSTASTSTVTVQYATADGTATAGSDYIATTGTLTFALGVTQQTISVTVNGDTLVESDETFTVNLSAPVNASLAVSQGTGTILNDDTASLPSLSINNVSQFEGNGGTSAFTFTASLSAASQNTVTVQFASADGTATAGSDYVATSGTLSFAPGQTQQTISVVVNGDIVYEPDESFFINLTNPTNATLSVSQGQGTIKNDDLAPDRYEPDDTIATAASLGKVSSISQSNLTLNTSSDVDYFSFAVSKSGTYTIAATPSQVGGTLNLSLFNSTLSPLGGGQSSSGAVIASPTLSAGQIYYVQVYSSTGSLRTYSLTLGKAAASKHPVTAAAATTPSLQVASAPVNVGSTDSGAPVSDTTVALSAALLLDEIGLGSASTLVSNWKAQPTLLANNEYRDLLLSPREGDNSDSKQGTLPLPSGSSQAASDQLPLPQLGKQPALATLGKISHEARALLFQANHGDSGLPDPALDLGTLSFGDANGQVA
jgi:hypothetical protein